MVRVVEASIRRFYKIYIEDDGKDMSDVQILTKAKEMILNDGDNALELETELDIEPEDILHTEYLYDIDD